MDEPRDINADEERSPPLDELALNNEKLVEGSLEDPADRGDRGRYVDMQALRELVYALHTVSIGTHQLLYFSSMKYAKNYLDADADGPEDAIRRLADIFNTENIGTLSLTSHEDDAMELELAENALTFDADTDKPICYFVSGYIAGFLENALGDHFVVNETSCISQGNKVCTFRAQRR